MKIVVFVVIVATAGFAITASAQADSESSGPKELTQANAILRTKLAQYDKEVRPAGVNNTGPVVVNINFYVRDIEKIDAGNQEWKIQMTFRLQWLDARLSYKIPYNNLRYISVVSPQKIDQIWKPDLFFANARKFMYHDELNRNQYIRIFPNGEVLYSMRITTSLSCVMMLHTFPHDVHTCKVRMASYGSTNEDILFKWKAADPIQVTSTLHAPDFVLRKFTPDNCDSQTNTGIYSCLSSDFVFQRVMSASWNHGYFTVIVAVSLGWLSFWLTPDSPSRIAIVLASFFYFRQVDIEFRKNYAPDVSYETIYDKFASTSFNFVLVSLIQFIFVSYLSSRNVKQNTAPKQSNQRSELQDASDPLMENNGTVIHGDEDINSRKVTPKSKILQVLCLTRLHERCKKRGLGWILAIDVVFRIVYPIAFIIFLFIFYGNISLLLASYEAGQFSDD